MDKPVCTLSVGRSSHHLLITFIGPEGASEAVSLPFDQETVCEKAECVFSCLSPSNTNFLLQELKDAAGLLTDCLLNSDLNNRLMGAVPGSYLVLALAPELAWIPWELAWDGQQFLCQRFCVARQLFKSQQELERTRVLINIRNGRRVLVACGNTKGIPAGVEREMIRKALNEFDVESCSQLTGDDLIKKLKGSYDILHFVGHGKYNEGQPSTGLLCTDRTVTCADIRAISSEETLPLLIFANACDSARASVRYSEGYITDLYRAFLSKGVPHYIGTIARVPAEASIHFAEIFYRELSGGETIGRSLQRARAELLREPGPPIWAYYVHFGYPPSRLVLDHPIAPPPRTTRPILREDVPAAPGKLSPSISESLAYSFPPFVDKTPADGEVKRALGFYDKAWRLFEAALFEEALVAIHQAERLWPKHEDSYWLEGHILLKQVKIPEAIDVFRHAVNLDPEISLSHAFLGQALEEAGKWPDALASHEKAYLIGLSQLNNPCEEEADLLGESRLDPALRHPHYYRGFVEDKTALEDGLRGACVRIYHQMEKDDLRAEFEKVRQEYRKQPDDRRLQIKLCFAYAYHGLNLKEQGAIDDAIRLFKEFSEIATSLDDPGVSSSMAFRLLGDAHCEKGLAEEALSDYTKALNGHTSLLQKITIYSNIANLQFDKKAFADTETSICAALKSFHAEPQTQGTGSGEWKRQHYAEVADQLHALVAHLYWLLSECRLAAKDFEGALKYNAKVVEFDVTREVVAAARRIVILCLKGNTDRAAKEFKDFPDPKLEGVANCLIDWGMLPAHAQYE